MSINRQIRLAARPSGAPQSSNFEATKEPIPTPGPGELLGRTIYLSLDPYMRGRMNAGSSYTSPVELGDVMVGGAVSEVMESNHPDYTAGDIVFAYTGWQEYFVSNGAGMAQDRPEPRAHFDGRRGARHAGHDRLHRTAQHRQTPTRRGPLWSPAASGPVGSLVGQIAKIRGCRAVGVAGGQAKCDYVVDELGFDACLDHRGPDLPGRLAAACPDGIDIYYENVGGAVFEAVLPPVQTSSPGCRSSAPSPTTTPPNSRRAQTRPPSSSARSSPKRITVRGMIVWDFADQEQDFLRDVSGWIRDRPRQNTARTSSTGWRNAPAALIGMLDGKNFGKLIVRVWPRPDRLAIVNSG